MKVVGAIVGFVVLALGVAVSGQDGEPASTSLLKATFGQLPVYFVENRGVCPDEVAYYIQGADKTLFFTRDGITFRLRGQDRDWVVKLEFVGGNPEARPEGLDKQQAVFSYFKGPPKDWKTGLRTYAKIVYRDLWPGIDLVYRGDVGALKYEFRVAPGADPAQIRLRYRGTTAVTTTDSGALRVETPVAVFEDAPPVAWQEIDGKRVPVAMAYRPGPEEAGDGTAFGFDLGPYDAGHPLVLDPAVLLYCGYLGGSGNDTGGAIAVDAMGNAYVIGNTSSNEQTFPVTVGPDPTYNGGTCDVFVAKVDKQRARLVYCGYVGGSAADYPGGIAVDHSGNAYLTGWTWSNEQSFPVTVGPDLTLAGSEDAFLAKVNPQGTGLVYCGYLGGAGNRDRGTGIVTDAAGNAYVTGYTDSTEQTFPVAVGPDLTYNGGTDDAFVAKVNAAGTGLVYCGYLGGGSSDLGQGIAVDAAANAYVTGQTSSGELTFPVAAGPDLTHNGGTDDAFVAKVNAAGTGLVYCGYLGGGSYDAGTGIAVDAVGNAYVTGPTQSPEPSFPAAIGPDLTYNGSWDAFVAKVSSDGRSLLYCGYIGGLDREYGNGIAVDPAGNAYVTGPTESPEPSFPAAVGPDLTYNGATDAFIAKVNAAGTGLVYCGYLGGSSYDAGTGIAVDDAGNAYVTGSTDSPEPSFPVVVGPDLTHNGNRDAFVARVTVALLGAAGIPNPGGQVNLALHASGDAGLPYQIGSSLGSGPIPIDTRRIELSPDPLLVFSTSGTAPTIFQTYAGVLDASGRAQAAIHIPNIPALIGIWLYTAFVTLDPQAPSGIRSISNTFAFPITK